MSFKIWIKEDFGDTSTTIASNALSQNATTMQPFQASSGGCNSCAYDFKNWIKRKKKKIATESVYSDDEELDYYMVQLSQKLDALNMTGELLDMAAKGTRDIAFASRMLGRCFAVVNEEIKKISNLPDSTFKQSALNYLTKFQDGLNQLEQAIQSKDINAAMSAYKNAVALAGKYRLG